MQKDRKSYKTAPRDMEIRVRSVRSTSKRFAEEDGNLKGPSGPHVTIRVHGASTRRHPFGFGFTFGFGFGWIGGLEGLKLGECLYTPGQRLRRTTP